MIDLDLQNGKDSSTRIVNIPMNLISSTECNKTFQGKLTENLFCTQHASSKSISECTEAKSGGAIQFFPCHSTVPTVVGIDSYGDGCRTTVPNVFTKVAYYLDWIESIVWP